MRPSATQNYDLSGAEAEHSAPPLTDQIPKVCGADVELGNFVLGLGQPGGTGATASKLLLAEVPGVLQSPQDHTSRYATSVCTSYTQTPAVASWLGQLAPTPQQLGAMTYDPQDWGRKFLPSNGGCVYIDLDHLELCIPEVRSAHEFVAAWHAMLLLARQAMESANRKLPHGQRLQVLANNSDGQGHSYGGHLNFLISRRLWENIFHRRLQYLGYLASFQASALAIFGQGKVGAENGAPGVPYQLSQRADFLETICAPQTTYRRPLVNSRDEALCGRYRYGRPERDLESKYGRLHCICFDTNLCHVACLLKVGVMQIVLAMLEADRLNPRLILDDPVGAARHFSRDPTLRARAYAVTGRPLTAVGWQLRFLDEALTFYHRTGFEGIVPRAGEILTLYADTLDRLRLGDMASLTGRLDWVLKLNILQRAKQQRPELDWDSPQFKHLDHLYSSLDADGLYRTSHDAGLMEQVASPADIEHFLHQPPEDTRAWTRAMLLRAAARERIEHIDWDEIRFRPAGGSPWALGRTFGMADPLGLTREDVADCFERERTLDSLLDSLCQNGPPPPASLPGRSARLVS